MATPPDNVTSPNALYYGDNLAVLREYISDESVDLIYLDPPFNSTPPTTSFSARSPAKTHPPRSRPSPTPGSDPGNGADLRTGHHPESGHAPAGEGDGCGPAPVRRQQRMTAYLVMMAPRLVELHRVLKPTGSIYLHCDPTAGHYLRLLMDATFGKERFKSQIVWKRTSAHSDTRQGRKQHGRICDLILFYTKGGSWTWNPLYTEYDKDYVDQSYRHTEENTGRRYRLG